MLDVLQATIGTLNSASPYAIIMLALLIIRQLTAHQKQLKQLRTNDLHEMPEMAESLRRIEQALTAGFATVIAKIDK